MVANLVTIAWFIFRISQKSQPTCSMAQMADRYAAVVPLGTLDVSLLYQPHSFSRSTTFSSSLRLSLLNVVSAVCCLPGRLNLWPLPRRLSSDSMSMLLRIFSLHLVGTSGMFLAQYLSGQWIFSWQNYWSPEKGWDYSKSVCGCTTAQHSAHHLSARSPACPRQNRALPALTSPASRLSVL